MYKLLLISFAFLLTVACTKQRDAEFAQGQGENLLTVSEYNGKTFEITTGAPIEGRTQSFSKAQKLDIKSKSIGDESFSVVSYEVNDPLAKKLLGDTPIVGKANTKYKGLIKVEQNYLKVYKVGKASDLPLSETTYAVKLNEEELAVPLIGYPITSRVSIDRAKNEYGEKSSTKIEKNEVNISDAAFFRFDMSKGEIFEPVLKTDVLPASYFSGEWFFTETVTAAPEEESENLGFVGGYDSALTPSTRIKFLSNETSMKVVNLNIDERLAEKADANFKTALTLPVSWKSYKVNNNGQAMSEAEDGKVHWSKRPFIQVDFDKSLSTFNNGRSRLVALEVKDDYLSFATEDGEGRRVRYSFLRVKPRNYTAKRLFKDDRRTYGFFTTQKSVVNNFEISRQEDIEKNTFISRFNPKAGKIVFNFTKTTPQWIRPSVKQAVESWNEAFAKAGVQNLAIVLDEEHDVELGDLRYNAINIIENLTASSLFGFGPSVTDPFTGEIISATTNVHLTPIREALISEMKEYIKMKLGLLEEGRSAGIAGMIDSMNLIINKKTADGIEAISDLFPSVKGLKMYLPDAKSPKTFHLKNVDFRARDAKNPREFDLAIASGNIHAEIEAQCPDLTAYIQEVKSQGLTHNEKENSVLDSCSRKLVTTKFLGTLVHEMGHNFGLRHNFTASNDSANFMSVEETQTKHQVRSSSVMEYSSFNEDRLVRPGPYDIAAIRFGYADSVELNDGKVVALDTTKNIAQNLGSNKARSFKFCTDEDVAYSTTPMCQRHDAGVTPLEVVKNIIADHEAFTQKRYFRGDGIRVLPPEYLAQISMVRTFIPLMRFYVEWRSGLARFLGEDNQYLENLTEKQFQAVINKMKADNQWKDFVTQYEPVSKAIFNFFFHTATMSNRYCVLEKGSDLVLNELEKVRSDIYFNAATSVSSCADAAKAGYWDKKGLKLVTEAGHFLNSFRFDLSDKAAKEPLDVVGTMGDRLNASAFLAARLPLGYDAMSRGFTPSMMDEPQFRKVVQGWALGRLIGGVPGSYVALDLKGGDEALKEKLKKNTFPVFSAESELNSTFFEIYKAGLRIPGKPQVSTVRTAFVGTVFVPLSQAAALKQFASYIAGNGGYIAVPEATSGAYALMSTYQKLSALRETQLIDTKNASIVDFVASAKASLPTAEELETITVKDMISKMDALKSKLATMDEANRDMALGILQEGAAIFQLADQIEGAQKSDNPQAKQQVEQILAAPFKAVLTQLMKLTSYPTAETLDKNIEANNANVLYYQENKVEIDAQIESIFAILSRGASR
ncbi:zinc-dependent metalloprotease [Bdellovibrio sp. HCB2-146]|uniref:zinc-dependent metalloprotease n=1 Tax=Bdellovibrio sp. HCB2-146 TaxID=3394362 RepID=UPI0039BCC8F9